MDVMVKELKNGKWALIGERDYVLMKAAEKQPVVNIEEIVKETIRQAVPLLVQQFREVKSQNVPKLRLAWNGVTQLAPSNDTDELRKQIHQMVSVLGQRERKDKGFAWHDAYILLYEKTGYDAKKLGAVYLKGKGVTLLNRVEKDGKLQDLLHVLRNHLYG